MTARKETAGEQELKILIGPKFPLWAQHPTDLSNQKVPGTNTVELIFAPAAAAIIFIKETGEDTGVSLANAGYDPNETRIPAGQPVGGQWTAAGAGGAQITKALVETPPPRLVLSGGNDWRLGESLPDLTGESGVEPITWGDVAEVWKGEGDAVTETVCGMWNAAWHPITTAEGIGEGLSIFAKDPGGTLKAIGQQIADDFTGGDLRKAGKLVGLVLITLGTGLAAGKLAPLLRKVPLAPLVRKVVAAASGKPVRLTPEEAEIVDRTLLKPYRVGAGHHVPAKSAFIGDPAYDPRAALAVPKSELEAQSVSHLKVTGVQRALYRAYAKTGQPLTWDAMQSIETQALV